MYKLSPSDFAYLYEECKRCYWMKVHDQVARPSIPMPGIFSAINTRLQGTLVGTELQSLSPDLPAGYVEKQEGFVESIVVPGTELYLKGKYDLLVKKPDGTYLLVDFKLSQPHEDKIDKYKTQLYSYKFALEHPRSGEAIAVSQMGLIIMYPDQVKFEGGVATLTFPPQWLEVPIDEASFNSFMAEVNTLITGPIPTEGEDCQFCKYRHVNEQYDLPHTEPLPF